MIFVDDFAWMNWARFLARKSNSTVTLRSFIADVATPANLKIRIICPDEGGAFQGQFQELLN